MYFPDYVKILQKNYKRRPGNEVLCTTLFDSVIEPLDLRSKNNDVVTITPATISLIMNRKADIPSHIRDNIYDDKVLSTIVAYFERRIVRYMRPEQSDICLQFINELQNDSDLSLQRLSEFKLMATPNTFA